MNLAIHELGQYEEPNYKIACNCGGKCFLGHHLYKLWLQSGIKFRCPKCNNFIESKKGQ